MCIGGIAGAVVVVVGFVVVVVVRATVVVVRGVVVVVVVWQAGDDLGRHLAASALGATCIPTAPAITRAAAASSRFMAQADRRARLGAG
jgi:hypothetical protein